MADWFNYSNNCIMTDHRYSRYSLMASSIVLLLGDVLQLINNDSILWTVCLAISFVLFVGGIPAINSLLYTSNKTFKLIINVFLLVGAIAGASMQVLFRTIIILDNEKFSDASAALADHPSLALTTMVPGILFPVGLILLCIALFVARKKPLWKVNLLLLGAISFPVGHAVGNAIALITGDVFLLSAWLAFNSEISKYSIKTTAHNTSFQ